MRVIILSVMLGLTPALALAEVKPAQGNTNPAQMETKQAPPAEAEAKQVPDNGKPSPDEVKRVINYYFHGKGTGPVLMETKLCHDIKREGADKNECAGDVTTQALKKGESVYLWMAYMVPEGEETQNIVVLFDKGGVTRNVESLQVSSQLRNRAWLKMSLDKVGPWKLRVVRDTGAGSESLGTLDVAVK